MRSATFVSLQSALDNAFGDREHILNRLGKDDVLVCPATGVRQPALRCSVAELTYFFVSLS